MPKQLYKITQFHGGLNSNSDARDIAENELSEATDVMVDELGKIRMMGGVTSAHQNFSGTIQPGYGLFYFSSDFDDGDGGGSPSEAPTNYIAYWDNANSQIDISEDDAAEGTNVIDLGSGGGKPTFYYVDGALRVSDGNFGANNSNKWYGYVSRRFFGDGSAGYSGSGYSAGLAITGWKATDNDLEALPIHFFGGNESVIPGGSTPTAPTATNPVNIIAYSDTDNTGYISLSTGGSTETLAMLATIDWTSTTTVQAKTVAHPGWDSMFSVGDSVLFKNSTYNEGKVFTVKAIAASPDILTFNETGVATGGDENSYLYNLSKMGFAGNADGWEVGMTTLYDDSKQESNISIYELTGACDGSGDISDTVLTDADAAFIADILIGFKIKNLTDGSEGIITDNSTTTVTVLALTGGSDNSWDGGDLYSISIATPAVFNYINSTMYSLKFEAHVFAGDGSSTGLSITHPRVSGFNIYMRRENTSAWYLQVRIDVEKGVKYDGEGAYGMWGAAVSGSTYFTFAASPFKQLAAITDPIQITEYLEEDAVVAEGGYKTAVIANRMAYIGNVKQNGRVYGDMVLKSNVNQFDRFPVSRRIETSINDGDDIVKLEAYADRLFIFKKNKLELVNISQEVEFLEDTFMHKGVSHPAATCKTDFGIAWVNKQGCYLYDGQKVNNLLEKAGRQIIKESDWATFTTREPMIGYIPKKRQLLIANDVTTTGDGAAYLYDIVTQSWVKGAAATITSEDKTNFITDWNGDLVYAHTSGTVVKWDDTGDDSTDFVVVTKDIDFGQPGQKKKIYKVYVTYTGVSSLSVNVDYQINGDNGWNGFSSGVPLTASSGQNEATLTLSTPVECYSFQLRFSGTGKTTFEINDATIVFRLKGMR